MTPKKSAPRELPVGGEMRFALFLGQPVDADLEEVLVALFLLGLVPLHNVVEAVGVDRRVGAAASAADRVLRADMLLALSSSED